MRKPIILLMMMVSFALQGQKLDFGVQLGGSFYDGDLSSPSISKNVLNLHGAGGAFVRFEYLKGFAQRVGVLYSTISGDDAQSPLEWQRQRNLHFRSSILEMNFMVELHPLKWMKSTSNYYVSPYFFFGAAFFKFNPQAKLDGSWIDLQPLGTEGQGMPGYDLPYDLTSWALPFGFGVRVDIGNHFLLDFEYGARRADTDYLDDISKNYVSVGDLSEFNGGLAARLGNKINADTGDKRGNYDVSDWYAVPVVSLIYRFDMSGPGYAYRHRPHGPGMRCPKF